jgi:hypothetical protein
VLQSHGELVLSAFVPRMTSRRLRALAAALALAGVASAAPAPARADATADQRASAQALFDDARRLMGDKRYAEACPKLEESQHLDPGLGTLLNLADCQAQTGRTASAWANFLEAAYQAKAAGQAKRETSARTRAAALEPRLSKLTILAVGLGGQATLRRDGAVVAASLVGTAVPVDPGEHVISASAPGRKPWETKIVVKGEGQQLTVSVPQLDDAPSTPPPGPDVKPPPPPEATAPPATDVKPPVDERPPPRPVPVPERAAVSGTRTAGLVLTVLGIGGLGAAAVFTVLAKQNLDSSNDQPNGCVGNTCPTGRAFDDRTTARMDGTIATGAWIGGGVVGGVGVALLIAASVMKDRPGPVPVVAIDPGHGASLGVHWRF